MDDLVDKTDHLSVSSKAFYKEVRRERAWGRRREAEGRGVRGGGGGGGQEEGERRGGKEQGEEEGGGRGSGRQESGRRRERVCVYARSAVILTVTPVSLCSAVQRKLLLHIVMSIEHNTPVHMHARYLYANKM